MVIFLAAFLGGQSVLTEIDRRALDTVARAEARQPRRAAAAPVVRPPVRRPVARRAASTGLDFSQTTTICRASGNQADPALFLSRMNEAETQAAILLGIDDPHIHDLAADLAKPCVLINCRDEAMRLSSIAPDHRLIGQFAAQYLFDMGHRAVLNVMCLRRYTMDLRLAGIKEAWRMRNLHFTDGRDLLTVASFSARDSEERVGEWLDARAGKSLPTAFLVGGDFMVAGTVSALQKRGLRVPQDISVMSIDGFNLAAIQDVPLTAVHVPRDELGTEAVHLLQQRLIRPDAPRGSLLLHGTLVVRDSVRRIRSGNRLTTVVQAGLYDD